MNFIKKLLFILSSIAGQLSVKTGAQTGGGYSTTVSTASSASPAVPGGSSTIASTVSRASSTVAGCGGYYTDLSGTISSPNYPSNYDTNLRCNYYIRLPTSQTSVNITFISFDTDRSGDWLQIKCYGYDHYYIPNQWFGGSTLPPPLLSISSCPTVLLLFNTDGSGTRQGFSLKYDIGNGMEGGLTMKPMNSYVRNDWPTTEPTILSCSSRANQTDAYPWWSYSRDGCSFFLITAPDCSVSPSIYDSEPKYFTTATQYSTRTCNLAISAQYINDAVGFYTCTDATLDFAFALVDSIDFNFTVVDFSSLDNEVVQGDKISLTCSVRLHHVTSTCFQLTPSLYIYSGDNESLIAVSNSTASINVTASANVLPSYVCRVNLTFKLTNSYPPSKYATNLPQNISSTKMFPPVLYWPESTSMVIHRDNNSRVFAVEILTCFVPANPPVTYQWTTQEYGFPGFPAGPTVTVSQNGTYTCTATNAIRGKTYMASKSINVTITFIDCGGTYSNLSGTISSPNYPSDYDDNLDCYYYIQVPPQKSVNITFISFATESGYDFLKVSCASNYDIIPNQTFSGSNLPPFLSISACSNVSLEFSTDESNTFQGFSLRYNIGDGMEGGLTMKPMNRFVRSDRPTTEPTILSCSSRVNQPNIYPWWSFSTDGSSFEVITAPDCSVWSSLDTSDPEYFSTSWEYSTRTCNLTISSVYINVAVGFYTCTDATLDSAVALVDAIDLSFRVSSLATEVVEGDQISLTCNVRLLSKTSSYFQLTPSVYIGLYWGYNQRPVFSTRASISVPASAEVLLSVCNINFTLSINQSANLPSKYATNLPQDISLKLESPPVLRLQGELAIKPMNRYVRSDLPITVDTILSCSSRANQSDAYPWWSFSTNGSNFMAITAPNCSVLPSTEISHPMYFGTSKEYSTGTCNLTISKLFIHSAVGFYSCSDAANNEAVALVNTIDPSFTVRATSALPTEAVQGEQISMSCNVRLLHKVSSYFQLTPSVYIYSGDNQRLITAPNTTATINVTASPEVVPPYVCIINFTLSISVSINLQSKFAKNLPEIISLNLTSPQVLYWPENTSMVIHGDDNGRVVANGNLTCFVPANPPVTYHWTSDVETSLQWKGSTVAVARNGVYTCIANNTIRNNTYEASKSISITIINNNCHQTLAYDQKNESLIAAVVLGIVVLLLLVVAIVQCVFLRRKKNSSTMDVNYDFIDAVIRTDADPAKVHVYELAERKRLDVDQGGAVASSGRKGVPPIPPMYDRIKDQTYDTEIHTEDKVQPKLQTYDTEIPVHTEDKSQSSLQTYDDEIPVHTEDKSQPKLQTYDDEIPVHTEDKSDTYLGLYE